MYHIAVSMIGAEHVSQGDSSLFLRIALNRGQSCDYHATVWSIYSTVRLRTAIIKVQHRHVPPKNRCTLVHVPAFSEKKNNIYDNASLAWECDLSFDFVIGV